MSIKKLLKNQRILIVDDVPDNLDVLKLTLAYYFADVMAIDNAPDALAWLNDPSHPEPTIIISDIQMPGMDGYALLSAIRAIPKYLNLPVLALTAHAMAGDREKILEAGFDGYVSKPMTMNSLEAGIKDAFQNRPQSTTTPPAPVGLDKQPDPAAAPAAGAPPTVVDLALRPVAGSDPVASAQLVPTAGAEPHPTLSLTSSEENSNV